MKKKKRGFAAMSKEKRLAAQRKGGMSTQRQGKARFFTVKNAKKYGRMGGIETAKDKTNLSRAGKLGAKVRWGN